MSIQRIDMTAAGEVSIILHNVRSAYNVGSIFRTADAVGIHKIYISGYTPSPHDRFGRKRNDIAKTALGAEEVVLWEKASSLQKLLTRFRHEQVRIVGVEQSPTSADYKTLTVSFPAVFLFGNEVRGISKHIQKQCDELTYIPMRGKKESLNVAVAVGIFLFRALNV